MRYISDNRGGFAPPEEMKKFNQQADENLKKPLVVQEEFGNLHIPIEDIKQGDEVVGLAIHPEAVPSEHLHEVFELYKNLVDTLYPLLLNELRKSGIRDSESELAEDHFISKKDLLKRTVLDFGSQDVDMGRRGDHFEQGLSRMFLDCRSAISDKFELQAFIDAATHEIIHYISHNEFTKRQETTDTDMGSGYKTKISGYDRKIVNPTYHDIQNGITQFSEGVVESYAHELYDKVVQSIDLDRNLSWVDYKGVVSDEDKKRGPVEHVRIGERKLVDAVIDHLVEYYGTERAALWDAVKRGLLEGQDLTVQPMKTFLEDCFGRGVIKDLSSYLPDKNAYLDIIENRWETISKKKLAREGMSLKQRFLSLLDRNN